MGGKTNEEEDLRNLHLYLVSLKEHIVPFFDTKVILYNACNSSEKTIEAINKYGLSNVVAIKRLEEMELPEKSYEFIKNLHFSSRIGLVQNMMFDYSKKNNFFDAEWIVQTDTDVEFLKDFKEKLDICQNISSLNSSIIISHAGDTYGYGINTHDKRATLKAPRRLNLYDDSEVLDDTWRKYELNVIYDETPRAEEFTDQQLKVKNDFVVMSRNAASRIRLNWQSSYTSINVKNATSVSIDNGENWEIKNGQFGITINKDKGSLVLFELQTGWHGAVHIQLPMMNMMRHIGGGWIHVDMYWTGILKLLEAEEAYTKYQNIWKQDFETNTQSAENNIV